MVDIAKCTGEKCEIKNECYRYLAKPCNFMQTYIHPEKKGKDCEYFWKAKSKSQVKRLDIINE